MPIEQCVAFSANGKRCNRIRNHFGKHYYKRERIDASGNIRIQKVYFTKSQVNIDSLRDY